MGGFNGPSGLKRSVVCNPVAHATGRGCAGLPALTELRNFKKRQRGICIHHRMNAQNRNPSLTFQVVMTIRRQTGFMTIPLHSSIRFHRNEQM
jgi:hypothetical protein